MRNLIKYVFIFLAITVCSPMFSQSSTTSGGSLDEGALESQFDYIMRKSTNYQGHKVIKKAWIDKFYNNFSDSLTTSYTQIASLDRKILQQQARVDSLNTQVARLDGSVAQISKEKDSFSLFGILLNKSTYNALMWGLILGLGAALAYFVFRFKRSHIVTTKARNSYAKTKEEFDAFRQKTLEKEQKLMRELQDELNKNTMNMG